MLSLNKLSLTSSKILCALCAFFATTCLFGAEAPAPLSEQEAIEIATEAYLYGYPLVTMDVTRQVMTNVAQPEALKSPMGQFINVRTYPDASFRDVTAPNADTLYSLAWLDVSKEPTILHVPDEKGRYYLMPMLSGWTDVFASPGTRTTGTGAQDFAITGPHWTGKLPAGVKQLKSPTNMVWIIGRTYCTGTPEDYTAVHAIQDQYTLVPLSFYGKPYTPPKGTVNPSIDMKTPVRAQVNHMDAATFFKRLVALMVANPPSLLDAPMIEKMAKLGIIPGKEFDFAKLDPLVARSLALAPKLALEEIIGLQNAKNDTTNGWHISKDAGLYGTNYLQRALVATIGLGANRPQDAVYPFTSVDSKGNPLSGKYNYVLHFAKGQTPPAKGFWSLTMYNDQYFFVANPLNRYTVSPRNNLKYNPDGSLDLYIQNESPGKDFESNWLPAPKTSFILMLRIYWPEASLLDGTWKPPGVQLIK